MEFYNIAALLFVYTSAMVDAVGLERMELEQDQRITDVVKREQSRLHNFIRRHVPDPRDAEDILQGVFHELVEANRLLMPIEHVAGWLCSHRSRFRRRMRERWEGMTPEEREKFREAMRTRCREFRSKYDNPTEEMR